MPNLSKQTLLLIPARPNLTNVVKFCFLKIQILTVSFGTFSKYHMSWICPKWQSGGLLSQGRLQAEKVSSVNKTKEKWARSRKTDIAGQSANLRSTVADKNKKINGGNKNKNLTSATWVCYPAPHLQPARQYCRLSICFIWVCIWICCLYLIRSTEATSNTDFLNIPKPQNISIFSPKHHHPNIASKLCMPPW